MNDQPTATCEGSPQDLDRVDQLASALFDNAITDAEVRELGVLLEQHTAARRRYLDNLKLHTDLIEHYGQSGERDGRPSPVLGGLGAPGESSVVAPPAFTPPLG